MDPLHSRKMCLDVFFSTRSDAHYLSLAFLNEKSDQEVLLNLVPPPLTCYQFAASQRSYTEQGTQGIQFNAHVHAPI